MKTLRCFAIGLLCNKLECVHIYLNDNFSLTLSVGKKFCFGTQFQFLRCESVEFVEIGFLLPSSSWPSSQSSRIHATASQRITLIRIY